MKLGTHKLLLITVALMLAWAIASRAQDISFDTRPRLELEPRLNLNGGGFQEVSGSATAGFGMEDEHFLWHVSGTYDAARKVNDGTGNNPHGDIRSLDAKLFGRTSGGWLYGADASFASLHTTNYDKAGWDVAVGGGHDWMHVTFPTSNGSTSLRLTVVYALPFRTVDTEQGFTAHFTLPSPAETHRHVFFDEYVFAGWIKPMGVNAKYGHDASTSMGLLLRF